MSKMVEKMYIQEEVEREIQCPNCGSKDIITDETRGEKICSSCGLVVEDRMVDFGTDWRAYNQDEREKRTRAEVSTYRINDDLSTYIGFENKDAWGQTLSAEKRSQLYRLRKWQLRIKSQDSKDRNLNKANQELERISSQLDIPRSVKITAGELYKKSFNAGVIKGYPINDMVAAAVYAAARVRRIPRTLDEVSEVTQVSKKRVGQCYRILVNRMNYKIPATKPTDFLIRMGTELSLSSNTQQLAANIIGGAKAKKFSIGKDPSGLAASALYLAGIMRGEKRNQKDVAIAGHVTEVTIRHRFKELAATLNGPTAIKESMMQTQF